MSMKSPKKSTAMESVFKCQAGDLQPYLKRNFGAGVYPVNVEEFSK